MPHKTCLNYFEYQKFDFLPITVKFANEFRVGAALKSTLKIMPNYWIRTWKFRNFVRFSPASVKPFIGSVDPLQCQRAHSLGEAETVLLGDSFILAVQSEWGSVAQNMGLWPMFGLETIPLITKIKPIGGNGEKVCQDYFLFSLQTIKFRQYICPFLLFKFVAKSLCWKENEDFLWFILFNCVPFKSCSLVLRPKSLMQSSFKRYCYIVWKLLNYKKILLPSPSLTMQKLVKESFKGFFLNSFQEYPLHYMAMWTIICMVPKMSYRLLDQYLLLDLI